MQCRHSRSHCVYLCSVDIAEVTGIICSVNIAEVTVFICVPVVYDTPRKETIVINN